MKCIVRGMKTPQIALELHISQRTVEAHRSNIKRKFGLEATKVPFNVIPL
jgi:DNA-binding NarL/FixJ family response regulator